MLLRRLGVSLGLQIAQTRSYLYTLRPKVGIIYVLGAMGYGGAGVQHSGLNLAGEFGSGRVWLVGA